MMFHAFVLFVLGQAAGVEVGDLLVSVDNIVAETPRLLAHGLKQTGLAHSGKLIVVKVREAVREAVLLV